ncbi:3-oxo-5-alpha-steroid 4-dehydrogenase-domain-containing protein [Myxozyma melibiosi]|uniref:3-oxo-5-alpha-steroid 4-dehydrogenase-domain-containing protein n=1 Tax=Myxozyma melibiosi TaxID=54550 RepID=A0ABR1FBB6_9ASCO
MVLLLLRQPADQKSHIANLPQAVEVDREESSVDDLVKAIQSSTHLAPSRLRLFLASSKTALVPNSPLNAYDMHDGTRVVVKDLGPQISRRTLLMTAYSGPVVIHLLFFYCQTLFYGTKFQHSASQFLAFTLITLHFAKRVFETLFVHVFYRITVSFYSIYVYILHYWVLSGVFMAYYIYYPTCLPVQYSTSAIDHAASNLAACSSSVSLMSSTAESEETSLYFLSAVWIFAELSNFETHLIIANMRLRFPRQAATARSMIARRARTANARLLGLRSLSSASHFASSMARRFPKGYGFDWVSCPNYFFELLAWTMITLITRSFASLLFLVASAMQMWRKAARKHEMYKKEFGAEYPKYRKVLIPFIK